MYKHKSTKKVKGFRISQDIVEALEKCAGKAGFAETMIVEASLNHFLSLKEDDRKRIIAEYLTRKF